jgi:hypothetical protein
VVVTRPGRCPVSGRHDLDGQLDQQRGGPADDVRAEPAAGQFGQVGQVGQLTDDHVRRLGRVRAGHRADTGGCSR